MSSEAATHRVRIGKVRLKGGAELRILPSRRTKEHDDCLGMLRTAVKEISTDLDGRMTGYALVAWSIDNWHSSSVNIENGSPINSTMVPSYVAEVLRRRQATKDARAQVCTILGIPES